MRSVLFLCTGNSARSIMAEAYLNYRGNGTWKAWSAGSKPAGKVNPLALETLSAHGIEASSDGKEPRSQSWDEFAAANAPAMEFVITVCDNAAGESCPVWPKQGDAPPRTLHWSFPDPAAATGTHAERLEVFEAVFADICAAIDGFLAEAETAPV